MRPAKARATFIGDRAHIVYAEGRTACGLTVSPDPAMHGSARAVPADLRCNGVGCRKWWPVAGLVVVQGGKTA